MISQNKCELPWHPSWLWTQLINYNFIILILSWKRWSIFLAEALIKVWRVGFLPSDWRNPLKPRLREMTTTQTAPLHLCCECSLVLGGDPDMSYLSFRGPKKHTNLSLKKFENTSGGLWPPSKGIRLWISPLPCALSQSCRVPWHGSEQAAVGLTEAKQGWETFGYASLKESWRGKN